MSDGIIKHKTLSAEEVLEYIAFAVWHRHLPDDFDGEITCELNEDGSVEVYATDDPDSDSNESESESNKILN